ncbi:hypothetical protein FJ434_19825 [Mesorhizobium sp. B2-5-13]|nr:hypothetical protein FJ434_19825 [Mesorhizobium sp. B2-5-13]TPK42563.1 hypothetical protein FJ560_25995 [Mesorhizobium sp. B2-5-5]TPM05333.1 hypothetical protein FJ960_13000 [Mesorhizobium sp. B2-3-11]
MDFEAWRDTLRTMCGRYNPEGTGPYPFAGWVSPVNVSGFMALNMGCNAERIERTYRDARLDSVDHYFAVFQAAGRSAMSHNEQAVELAPGDVAFVDSARPATYFANNGSEAWNTVTLNLPRQSLVSHLGFEPQGGMCIRRQLACRRAASPFRDRRRNRAPAGSPRHRSPASPSAR